MRFWPFSRHRKSATSKSKGAASDVLAAFDASDADEWLDLGPIAFSRRHATALLSLTRQPAFPLLLAVIRAMKAQEELDCLDERSPIESIRYHQGRHAGLDDFRVILARRLPDAYASRLKSEEGVPESADEDAGRPA